MTNTIKLTPLEQFLTRIYYLTKVDFKHGQAAPDLFRHVIEELGELAAAHTVELGQKTKTLRESTLEESVDLLITIVAYHLLTNKRSKTSNLAKHALPDIIDLTIYYTDFNPDITNLDTLLESFVHNLTESSLAATRIAWTICQALGLKLQTIIEIGNIKLNKWEINQNHYPNPNTNTINYSGV